jgi:ATP-binding cassette subfamily F protein 3
LRGAVKLFDRLTVYDGISLEVERGARIALVGPNGAGKSTMTRLLAGVEELTAGERILGDRVRIGYFSQNLSESLDYEQMVLEELSREAQGMTTSEIRNLLGAMLFSGDDVRKRVGVLSGGERGRLALAKVLAHRNNCLLLDEPTNNLDIIAKDTLLEALKRFPGTVVLVSHDRHILNQLVTEVIEVGQGHATRYLGNYDEYLEKKAADQARAASAEVNGAGRNAANLSDNGDGAVVDQLAGAVKGNGRVRDAIGPRPVRDEGARQADREAQRNRARLMKQRASLEAEIEKKESERAVLCAEMSDPNFYLLRQDADQMISRYDRLGREIDGLYQQLVNFEAASE